jgi:hypothetical protein
MRMLPALRPERCAQYEKAGDRKRHMRQCFGYDHFTIGTGVPREFN